MRFLKVLALCAASTASAAECDPSALLVQDPTLALSWTPMEVAIRPVDRLPPLWGEASGQDPGVNSGLGATPEARWAESHARALAKVEAMAVSCSVANIEELALERFVGLYPTPTPVEALKRYSEQNEVSSALLSSVLSTTGAFPAHVPIQVGLSQLVTNGQPAVAPTIAGTPGPHSDSWFLRHFSLAGSALLVTPASASPVLSSFDLSAAISNQVSPDDWLRMVNKNLDADEEALAVLARSATAELLTRFKNGRRSTPAERQAAFDLALAEARSFYDGRAVDLFVERYVRGKEQDQVKWNWALTARFRGTPDAAFVPELPDLFSGSAEGSARLDLVGGSFGTFSLSGSFALAYSGYPSKQFARWSEIGTKPDVHGFRGDFNLGLSVNLKSGLPTVQGARLTALAAGRLLAGSGTPDGSVGASVLLEVPVSANVALVGSLIARCNRTGCIQTSGITLAVSKLN